MIYLTPKLRREKARGGIILIVFSENTGKKRIIFLDTGHIHGYNICAMFCGPPIAPAQTGRQADYLAPGGVKRAVPKIKNKITKYTRGRLK